MIKEPRVLCWFSCGAASAVATKLALERFGRDRVTIVYCETGAEHPDNSRFMADFVCWVNAPVTSIKSDEYKDTWDVWEKTGWLAGIKGARCTTELKKIPRIAFQRPHDIHVFGYTNNKTDVLRAANFRENFPELTVETPLIKEGLSKEACLSIVEGAGLVLPILYSLGFHNNNCIPCVKATSPNYWALVRKEFPNEFSRMVKLSRRLGVRLARIKNIRVFIDEIPLDQPTINPIVPTCDFMCHIIRARTNTKEPTT